MKIEIAQLDLGLGETHLAGRVIGDRLFANVIAPALRTASERTVLLLSFRHVEFVTGSIVKATWHRLRSEGAVAVPSALVHLSEDVRSEFDIYLRSERLAAMEARDWGADAISSAALLGHLEDSAFSALQGLSNHPGSTAPELQSASLDPVSATAWTNRLNELHAQGLALREKAGRAWRFFPVAREIQPVGREVHRG